MEKVRMIIDGIDSRASAEKLKNALEALGETKNIKVDQKSGTVTMETSHRDERLKIEVETQGYTVKNIMPLK